MNKKIIVPLIIILIFGLIVGGYFLFNLIEKNKKKDYLDGIYVTPKEYMPIENGYIKRADVNVITFYPNNIFSIYSITIKDIANIGIEISQSETATGTYILSNESKSILINIMDKSETYRYENNYKTLKGTNKEYNLLECNIEDYIPKDTIKVRNTAFEGKYVYEKTVDYVSGMIYSAARQNEEPLKMGTRYTMDFLDNGTISQKVESFNIYASDNAEIQTSFREPIIRYYSINNETNEMFVYSTNGQPYYEKYTLSNDLKEITTDREEVFKLVEQSQETTSNDTLTQNQQYKKSKKYLKVLLEDNLSEMRIAEISDALSEIIPAYGVYYNSDSSGKYFQVELYDSNEIENIKANILKFDNIKNVEIIEY